MIFTKNNFIRPEFGALFFFDERRFEEATKDKTPEELSELFKTALSAGDSHLEERFREGESIHKLVRDRSAFIDRILYYAWQQFEWDDDKDISLVAVGGYGRGEMHPHSDIDLLFILRKDNPKKYEDNLSKF